MKHMSKMDVEAKKDVLKELLEMAMEEMRGANKRGLDEAMSMKKVSVMAPDKEGLKQGLEKAEEVIEGEESPVDEEEEMEEPEMSEDELSDDEKKDLLKKMMK